MSDYYRGYLGGSRSSEYGSYGLCSKYLSSNGHNVGSLFG